MKHLILILLLPLASFAQDCAYKIITPIYTGCYSLEHKNPTYIRYKLYKGGGDCKREGMTFKHTNYTANPEDYAYNGYDEGHMANAEDFAADCNKELETFWFYNCVPQTPNLNRGIWKTDETAIRDLSQKDSLLIICGPGYYKNPKSIGTGVTVPDYCWKFVQSLSTGKIYLCRYYTNLRSNNTSTDYSQEQLESLIGFKLRSK